MWCLLVASEKREIGSSGDRCCDRNNLKSEKFQRHARNLLLHVGVAVGDLLRDLLESKVEPREYAVRLEVPDSIEVV